MDKYNRGSRGNDQPIANERIRYNELRVVGDDNEQLGIMSKRDALDLAMQQDKDLVIITEKSSPPVARIVDLNKYNYELKKREKEAAKKAREEKLKVKPKKGLTIIWPADWTFKHRGITSPTETKWICTGWLSYQLPEEQYERNN